MYKLYYSHGLASLAPHFVLREIGVPFELVRIDRSKGEHKSPQYLAINPNGRIPTFQDGDFALFEAAAICLHLADHHPEASLIPALGTPDRSRTYQWLTFLTNTLQADLWQFFRPEFYAPPERQADFKATMDGHVVRHLGVLDRHLEGRDHLAGETLTIADLYLLMLGRWSRHITQPTRSFGNLTRVLDNVCRRPAVVEAFRQEEIAAPYF